VGGTGGNWVVSPREVPVFRRTAVAAGLLSAALVAGSARAGDVKPEIYTFGSLKAVAAEAARSQAQEWLVKIGRTDDATRKQFDSLWKQANQTHHNQIAPTPASDATAAQLVENGN